MLKQLLEAIRKGITVNVTVNYAPKPFVHYRKLDAEIVLNQRTGHPWIRLPNGVRLCPGRLVIGLGRSL
jgi:hypothetical protein